MAQSSVPQLLRQREVGSITEERLALTIKKSRGILTDIQLKSEKKGGQASNIVS